jgi:hypothetical protein
MKFFSAATATFDVLPRSLTFNQSLDVSYTLIRSSIVA